MGHIAEGIGPGAQPHKGHHPGKNLAQRIRLKENGQRIGEGEEGQAHIPLQKDGHKGHGHQCQGCQRQGISALWMIQRFYKRDGQAAHNGQQHGHQQIPG